MANGIWSWHGWLSTQKSLWLSTWAKLSCREPRCRRCRRPTQRWEKMGRTVSKDWLAILGHNTLKFARLLFAVFSPFQLCHDQPEPACNASHQARLGDLSDSSNSNQLENTTNSWIDSFQSIRIDVFLMFLSYIIYTFNALPSLGSAPSSCVRAEPSPEQKSQQGSRYSLIQSYIPCWQVS